MQLLNTDRFTPLRETRIWVPAALLVIIVVALIYARRIFAPCDDTYIYLVYARNFLEGNGFTFNGDKVQGFTSALWLGLITVVGKLGVDLPRAADLLSMLSGVLAILAAYRLGRKIGLGPAMSLIVPTLLATTWNFVFYMSNGLETCFFAAMLLFAVGALFGPDPSKELKSFSLPMTLGLAILARPEGALAAVFIIGYLAWQSRSVVATVRCCVGVFIWVAPLVVATKQYYGDWLPNTYYAKSGGGMENADQGLQYLVNYLQANGIMLGVMVGVFALGYKRIATPLLAMLAVALIWTLHITIAGGDNMVGYRALLPVTPLFFLFAISGLRAQPRIATYLLAFVIAYNFIVWTWGTTYGSSWNRRVTRQATEWRTIYPIRVEVAEFLKRDLKKNSIIAVNAAGIIPYYSGLRTIDMLGLNCRHIARNGRRDRTLPYGHQAGDGNWVLDQRPDVILLGGIGSKEPAEFVSDQDIYKNGEFKRLYNAKYLTHDKIGYYRWQRDDRRSPRKKRTQ